MKLLHVVPSFYPAHIYGGPIESVYAFCRGLVAHGVDLRVLSTDANGLGRVLAVEKDREALLPGDVRVRYCRRLLRHSVSLELLGRLTEAVRWADVVHLTAVYSFPTLPTLLACKLFDKPLIWSPRGALQRWQGSRKLARKRLWQSLCALAAPRSLTLHVTSPEEANESRSIFPRAQIARIANGVEIPVLDIGERPAKPLRLVYLGRLDPKKGLENLLDCCALVKRNGRLDFTLTIAGAGEPAYEDSLRARAAALDLADKVAMIGAVYAQAKTALLAGASLVVVPSHTENFAMVVAEALAHGAPVIASKGTPWQKLEAMSCGLWVDNDAASLASAIERMAAMPLAEMGRRGRAWMAREFSWQERAAEMMQLYRSSTQATASLAIQPA
jgi:glycosyltransferase involved in cell wall biosynthesis